MKTITLTRTGDRPLRFTGEEVAEATSRQDQGACQTRYYELALYRTDSDRYVLAIGYRSHWEGELPDDRAYIEDSIAGIVETLRSTTPELPLLALPPGEAYADKRAHIEQSVRRCYEQAVTELLADVEPESI